MQLAVIQPPYPGRPTAPEALACLEWMDAALAGLEPGRQDLLVLPEYANVPGLEDPDLARAFARTEGHAFLVRVAAQSARLCAPIAVGALLHSHGGWVNRTQLLTGTSDALGYYDKTHLTQAESVDWQITAGSAIPVLTHGGLRLAFAVCFDLYFPEYFAALATLEPDLILCPSYQRSESPQRTRLICQARALDSGCYLARSSYAIAGSQTGAHSLVAAPDGSLLADAGREPGIITVPLDPHRRFVKPRSHGQPPVEHRSLIQQHRRPRLYAGLLGAQGEHPAQPPLALPGSTPP